MREYIRTHAYCVVLYNNIDAKQLLSTAQLAKQVCNRMHAYFSLQSGKISSFMSKRKAIRTVFVLALLFDVRE